MPAIREPRLRQPSTEFAETTLECGRVVNLDFVAVPRPAKGAGVFYLIRPNFVCRQRA